MELHLGHELAGQQHYHALQNFWRRRARRDCRPFETGPDVLGGDRESNKKHTAGCIVFLVAHGEVVAVADRP